MSHRLHKNRVISLTFDHTFTSKDFFIVHDKLDVDGADANLVPALNECNPCSFSQALFITSHQETLNLFHLTGLLFYRQNIVTNVPLVLAPGDLTLTLDPILLSDPAISDRLWREARIAPRIVLDFSVQNAPLHLASITIPNWVTYRCKLNTKNSDLAGVQLHALNV